MFLWGVKAAVDQKVLKNQRMMDNHAFFSQEIMPSIIQSCRKSGVKPTLDQVKFIDQCISTEYFCRKELYRMMQIESITIKNKTDD